jgi:uncharacterized membrane protein
VEEEPEEENKQEEEQVEPEDVEMQEAEEEENEEESKTKRRPLSFQSLEGVGLKIVVVAFSWPTSSAAARGG